MFTTLASRPACIAYGLILGAASASWISRSPSQSITPSGIAFEQGQPDAGIGEATPVTRKQIDQAVVQLVDAGTPDTRPFAKQHKAHPDSVTTAKVVREQDVPGVSQAKFSPAIPSPEPADWKTSVKNLPPTPSPLAYDWHDLHNRFRLHDPDTLHPGQVTFTARQAFRLSIVGIAQDGSPLRQEQVSLQEVDPETGAVIGPAEVRDLRYSYVPAKPPPDPRLWVYGGVGAQIGASDLSAPVLAIGASYRVLGPFTLGGQVQATWPLWHLGSEPAQIRGVAMATAGLSL